MECPTYIKNNNHLLQEDQVYTFLDGLDDHLDKIRGDVLQYKCVNFLPSNKLMSMFSEKQSGKLL